MMTSHERLSPVVLGSAPRRSAGMPVDTAFRTKPQLVQAMLAGMLTAAVLA